MTAKRRKITVSKRHWLAVRDGLAYWLWGPQTPFWLYQCSVCRKPMRTRELTGGHIVPRGEGGSDEDDNLRLECEACNWTQNAARTSWNSSRSMERIHQAIIRQKRERVRNGVRSRIFHNVPVYWEGELISFTSEDRRKLLIKKGDAKASSDGGMLLLRPPLNDNPSRRTPIPNECVRCGQVGELRPFRIYPRLHPEATGSRRSDTLRPTCVECYDEFEIVYAIKITSLAQNVIIPHWSLFQQIRNRRSWILESWSRRRAGVPLPDKLVRDVIDFFAIDPRMTSISELRTLADGTLHDLNCAERLTYKQIGELLTELQLDFRELFRNIAAGEIRSSQLDIPKIPLTVAHPRGLSG